MKLRQKHEGKKMEEKTSEMPPLGASVFVFFAFSAVINRQRRGFSGAVARSDFGSRISFGLRISGLSHDHSRLHC